MENVDKKEDGVPKSTPSTPSMAIHRESRTISKVYTRRTKTTRVERFHDSFTSHNDPNSSTSTPPSPPPPVLVDQQEVVTEEEKTYYVDWNDYDDWPGFFKDLREAIKNGFFDDIMINPDKDPNKKVQEKFPDTQGLEPVTDDKKVQEKLPDTQNSESATAEKVQEKLPDTQSSEFVTADKVQEKLPHTQSSEFITADKGTSPFESLQEQSHFGTNNTDIRDSGLYWHPNMTDPEKDLDKTTEIEEYQEKSYMSKYTIYGSIPTGTETIDPRGEESMQNALISGINTVSEGLQENTAEVQKQALPVESPRKKFDMFHKIMYGIWQHHNDKTRTDELGEFDPASAISSLTCL